MEKIDIVSSRIMDFEKYYASMFKIANRQIFAGDKATIDNRFTIGFGYDWDFSPSLYNTGIEIDVFAFLVGPNGKILSDNHMVFYNSEIRVHKSDHSKVIPTRKYTEYNLRSESCPVDPEISVIGPYEDNTGARHWEADDDIWNINLNRVHPDVEQIIFYTNIYSSNREQSYDGTNVVLKFYYPHQHGLETEYLYVLNGNYSSCKTIEICSINRTKDGWEILPVGIGHPCIEDILKKHLD